MNKKLNVMLRPMFAFMALFAGIEAAYATAVEWYDGRNAVTYSVSKKADPVVATALEMFSSDMEAVTGRRAEAAKNSKTATVAVVEADRASASAINELKRLGVPVDSLMMLTDGFHISLSGKQITVVGRNGRGTAYGLLELSRMAGVSPWIWWGDVVPERRPRLTIDSNFRTTQGASVEYRGVFINDEDWSIRPWSSGTHEPGPSDRIGPRTYRRIFELLLRHQSQCHMARHARRNEGFLHDRGCQGCCRQLRHSHRHVTLRAVVAQ